MLFLFAMVKCGELPCTISNVAKNLHKNVNPIRYKELDFTVPEFDGFIRRLSEYKQWCKEDESTTTIETKTEDKTN